MSARRHFIRGAGGWLAATLAPTSAWTTAARADELDSLHARARAEGQLSIYGGGPERLYRPWIDEFEQRFPGIRVSFTGGYAGTLTPRIDRQLAAGQLECDFVTFQAVQEFIRWKKEGVLLAVKGPEFNQIDARFRDPEGAYTPVGVFAIAPAYNTRAVAAADIPRSALDLLKPAFRGKLITAYPADDDATLYAFDTLVRKYGWKFMDDYMAQQPRFIQGHLGVVRSLIAGESTATFDMMAHHTLHDRAQGAPIDIAFPTDDPLPIWGQLGAIFKASPHPNAARLWLAWYMAREQQARIGTWSARTDVKPPFGLKPIFEYNVANDLADLVNDPKRLAETRRRFLAYTGEVVNRGGTQ